MRLASYYDGVPELKSEEELKLVCLWRKSWSATGFEPFVLNEFIARKHPYFAEYEAAVSKLPSANPAGYDRCCWLRWLALAQVGGGFMADYDLFSNGGDSAFVTLADISLGKPASIQLFQGHIPSLVYASAEAALALCREFATGNFGHREQDGKPHVSDMTALEDLLAAKSPLLEARNLMHNFNEPGWETAQFVHYANATMQEHLPRWKHIPLLRPL